MLQHSGGQSLAASSSLYSRAIDRKARMSPALTMFPETRQAERKTPQKKQKRTMNYGETPAQQGQGQAGKPFRSLRRRLAQSVVHAHSGSRGTIRLPTCVAVEGAVGLRVGKKRQDRSASTLSW